MLILGVSAYHGDSSAAVLRDGKVVAAVEEERFTRIKHWAGLPLQSIAYCLDEAGVALGDVDYIAVNRDPKAQLLRKVGFVLRNRPPWEFLKDRLLNRKKVLGVDESLAEEFGVSVSMLRPKIKCVEHHLAHAASAYCMSPFDESAIITVDGFGDWTSTMCAMGRGSGIKSLKRVFYPHSLGVVYTAVTQFLGFPNYGDEYKVMGLAPYGEAKYLEQFRQLVRCGDDGTFALAIEYFSHGEKGIETRWDGGSPTIGELFTAKFETLFGAQRRPGEPLEQRHKDIAASLQAGYEEVFTRLLAALHRMTGCENLCIAGGCAMNSVANGKIRSESPFTQVYIPPQPGDGGGSLGAAAYVYGRMTGQSCQHDKTHAFIGPRFDDAHIEKLLAEHAREDGSDGTEITRIDSDDELCAAVARYIADGKVVGWFQGRMEWGPRALGNRSILADPRRGDMKDILNLKVKRRESFRPFAPSILRQYVDEYFETDYDVPFMSMVFQIRPDKREALPAVTHVNGSGRLQTVSKDENPLYWRLIDAVRDITGVPVVLNTSFNENEPIVCGPDEALDCFLRTKMDVLVLNRHVIRRLDAAEA